MKFCTHCGAQMDDNAVFCTHCGASQNGATAAPVYNTAGSYTHVDRNISFKEYVNTKAEPNLVKQIRTAAIVCYICLGINLVSAILFNFFGLIDVVVLGALTLGMHLGKSKGCAIALLVVSIISTLVSLVLTGSFTGYLWIIAGGIAVAAFNKLTKAYKAFQEGKNLSSVEYTA